MNFITSTSGGPPQPSLVSILSQSRKIGGFSDWPYDFSHIHVKAGHKHWTIAASYDMFMIRKLMQVATWGVLSKNVRCYYGP